MSKESLVKIEVRTAAGDEVNVETPWAVALGDDQYELRNSPFFAYDVSFLDVVRAESQPDGGFPLYAGVVRKCGHRTIRIASEDSSDGPVSQDLLETLVGMGCTYEGANPRYLAIDIPASVDLALVRNFLIERGACWEHADPSYGTLYGHADS